MELNQTIDIGTDIASFFLFHPDDLAHRADDPLDWHGYEFACRKEFEAGNLVAFRTGSDGGFQLRLTSGNLTDAEHALQTGSWEFGYTVRHGKIFVDNGDYMPSDEVRSIKKAPADQWVAVPNGDYRVSVYPIARKDDSLPDYVVCFAPVDAPLRLAPSPTPPEMAPFQGDPPRPGLGLQADDTYKADETPLLKTYPLLVVADSPVLPGVSRQVPVADPLFRLLSDEGRNKDLADDAGDIYLVAAPDTDVPGLATLAWVNGWSQITSEPGQIKLQGKRLVRVTKRTEASPLPFADVEPVTRSNAPLETAQIKNLQADFDRWAEKHTKGRNKIAAFERERVAAMTKAPVVTTRLLEILPLPAKTRFKLYEASDKERAEAITAFLNGD